MAYKNIGFYSDFSDVAGKPIKCGVRQSTIVSITNNNAIKFAVVALPDLSGTSANYCVYLVTDDTTLGYDLTAHYVYNNTDYGNYYQSSFTRQAEVPPKYMYCLLYFMTNISKEDALAAIDEYGILNIYDPDSYVGNMMAFLEEVFDHPANPPKGQGTVTLDIPANGITLTFTSSETGKVVSQFIDSNAVVNIE